MGRLARTLKRSLRSLKATEYAKKTGKKDWSYVGFELYCAFMDTCIYSWLTPIQVFKESCIRTAKWLPIIWKDRHWDDYFIFEILKHKIRFTRENIRDHGYHANKDRTIKTMRIAEILIERLQKDNYSDLLMQRHEAKWGKYVSGSRKDNIMFDNKFSCSGLRRENVKSQTDWELEFKEHKKISEYDEYMKKQDKDYLFKHLNKHINKWWD